MLLIHLLMIVGLIVLTSFFVAIEFAIVKVRTSRIDQLIAEGKKNAIAAKQVVTHLDEYLSATQLGITVTALGLGWLGEPTVERLFHPFLTVLGMNDAVTQIVSFVLAFALVTFIHVVAGELAPKTVAIQKAETITLLFAKPIILFYKIMYPFIWALNNTARMLVGLFGLKSASENELAHSEEELRILLSESLHSGEINQNEWKYVNNIFEFDERVAKEIMVPRTEMVCLSVEDSVGDVVETMRTEKFTRYPVMESDKDHIIGVMNVKMFFTSKLMNKGIYKNWKIKSYVQPVIRVMETIPIHDLLIRMQMERTHMAILLDEYGGTSGLVTVEDILEEIVGEVRDEFDADEVPEIRKVSVNGSGTGAAGNHYIVDAKVPISEVNQLLGTNLSAEDVDTIGGWYLTQNNETELCVAVDAEGYSFHVHEADGYHIMYLEISKN
ncbi:HlyC/CorC family transporter [Neobacillus sp. MM2021_6]|uniref:hemolysin family protein n=1 Tax=Bacillaceae TaxID=186817 RepID=UPI001408946E|nr:MULTISPECIES: hemolysin family protein [Bacillaceae]MBO0958620.1 HlyC/CorC family transporter [Neobacillus sp. MM2021_6]NHC18003.1 HlyC/CorC family transporter [Bacillus sp. MM2020_4]